MANKAEYARRFGMLFMAGLFLITSIAFTAIILWQAREQDSVDTSTDLTSQLQEQLNDQTNQQEAGMLQGTNLENFTPLTEPVTAIESSDVVVGTGQEVKRGDTITAHYTGANASTGVIFQSSLDSGSPFNAVLLPASEAPNGQGLIQGWVDGLPGMKVGGKRRLIIPSAQAYNEGDLVFDIELVSIDQ